MSGSSILSKKGAAYLRIGKDTEAISEFNRIIEIGNTLLTQSKKEEALDCAKHLKSVLKHHLSRTQSIPEFGQLWYDLGELFKKLNQVEKAKQCDAIVDNFVFESNR